MASMLVYIARSSVSVSRALLISCSSFSVVSWYRYLIRSSWVKVFIIGKMVCIHFFSQVNECVTHPAQSCVNAHPGAIGNFLKTHFQIMPHNQHLLLLGWQLFDQSAKSGFVVVHDLLRLH